MKRFISFLTLAFVASSSLLPLGAAASSYSYTGPSESNAFADRVVSGYTLRSTSTPFLTVEKTAEALSTTSSDVYVGEVENDALYVGYEASFDGMSLDMGTSATGGAYAVEYWDGSEWSTLVNETSASLKDSSTSGVFSVGWTVPSDWSKKSMNMGRANDGTLGTSTESLYFVRLRITSDYASAAYASQVGVLKYNVLFEFEDERGYALSNETDAFSISFSTSTTYAKKRHGTATEEYAIYTSSSSTYSYTANIPGYVEQTGTVTVNSTTKTEKTVTLPYAYVVTLQNEDGNKVSNATVKTGDNLDITCTYISNGEYGCVAGTNETEGNIKVTHSDYETKESTFATIRNSDDDAQVSKTLTLTSPVTPTPSSDDIDLTVNDIMVESDEDLLFELANIGDEDVDSDENVYVYVYFDDSVVWSESYNNDSSSSFLNAGEEETINIGDEFWNDYDDGDRVDVKVCVDARDTVDEDSESNNCETDTFEINRAPSTNDEVDLTVSDIVMESDGDLKFEVANIGDEDVDSDESVAIYVYVEGKKEWSQAYGNTSSTSFLDAGEESTITVGDDIFNDYDAGDEVDVKVCVDALDTVDEDSESNNCRTETVEVEGVILSSDGVDLKVSDLYMEADGDIRFKLENIGDEDVSSGKTVYTYVYVDGSLEWSGSVSQSSNDDNEFLDSGEITLMNVGDELVNGHGSTYDVKVCVDAKDTVDEDNESNNCMTEDEDELAEGANYNSNECSTFVDIENHWAEEYICNLYDRETVKGRTLYRFEPSATVTRAEFLKMVLLDAGLDPYTTVNPQYSDVSTRDWFYSYVTYATTRGYVYGYRDGTFQPNSPISRAEAVVILMRVAGQEDWDFNASDIDYSDVKITDWFSYAVVMADEFGIVEGYSNGSFRPQNYITRGEAAKIVDVAYEQFYQ